MPPRDEGFWAKRFGDVSPCHYQEKWMDLYSRIIRRAALKRIMPKVTRVLDVGCGDGRMGEWLRHQFGCKVWGVDYYEWPGVANLLNHFSVEDAESVDKVQGLKGWPDLAVMLTVLPFVQHQEKAVAAVCRVCNRVLVLDNLPDKVPEWQQGLSYKKPLDLRDTLRMFASNNFFASSYVVVNYLDRRLFMWLPGWMAFLITTPIDLLWSRLSADLERARHVAILFERRIR